MAPDLAVGSDGLTRCWWCGDDPTYVAYHDDEWGRPLRDEQALFELTSLESFQAGLAWITVLRKRPAFRAAFAGFDIEDVAGFGPQDIERLLQDPGIIRHRGKIEATIALAQLCLDLRAEGSSLVELVWSHRPPARPRAKVGGELPAHTPESAALARDLKARGAKFFGPTTAYALMQSAGLVDDHLAGCHRAEL